MSTKSLTFGEAIKLLKDGHKLARVGWNGKNMYVSYVHEQFDEKMSMIRLGYLEMMTSDRHIVPWLASQTDVLANDWMVVRDFEF